MFLQCIGSLSHRCGGGGGGGGGGEKEEEEEDKIAMTAEEVKKSKSGKDGRKGDRRGSICWTMGQRTRWKMRKRRKKNIRFARVGLTAIYAKKKTERFGRNLIHCG